MRTRIVVSSLALCLVAGSSITACGSDSSGSEPHRGSEADAATGGPLQIGTAGGFGFTPPRTEAGQLPHTWAGTTGSFLLCTEDDDVDLISIVPIEGEPAPIKVKLLVRTVEDANVANGAPIISAIGSAPDFPEAYATQEPLAGSFTSDIGSVEVVASCSEQARQWGFMELLVIAESGAGGSLMTGLRISYRAGGKMYRDTYPYDFANCGPDVSKPSLCPPA